MYLHATPSDESTPATLGSGPQKTLIHFCEIELSGSVTADQVCSVLSDPSQLQKKRICEQELCSAVKSRPKKVFSEDRLPVCYYDLLAKNQALQKSISKYAQAYKERRQAGCAFLPKHELWKWCGRVGGEERVNFCEVAEGRPRAALRLVNLLAKASVNL